MSVREFRLSIGADILKAMERSGDLPLQNVYLLAGGMEKCFEQEGFIDELIAMGYTWRPTVKYWKGNLNDIRYLLRKDGKIFEYKREQNGFSGQWMFMNKKDFDTTMKRELGEMGTRTENFNDRLVKGKQKWNLQIPSIEPVKQLPLFVK